MLDKPDPRLQRAVEQADALRREFRAERIRTDHLKRSCATDPGTASDHGRQTATAIAG